MNKVGCEKVNNMDFIQFNMSSLVGGYVILWSKENFNCFDDYSNLEPMKHDFFF
jgi:hypothetical protein